MGYQTYLDGPAELVIRPSVVESRASGLEVGRLDVWPAGSADGRHVARLIVNRPGFCS